MKGRFDWRAAYFNVVSLVAIIFFLFAAVSAGQAILRLLFPALSMDPYAWEAVESFDAYKRQGGHVAPKWERSGPDVADSTAPPMTEEEIRQSWQEHRRLSIEGQKRRGLWNLLESLVTIAVSVPVLLLHRRAAKRLKPEPEQSVA